MWRPLLIPCASFLPFSGPLSPRCGEGRRSSDGTAQHQLAFLARQPGDIRTEAAGHAARQAVCVLLCQLWVWRHDPTLHKLQAHRVLPDLFSFLGRRGSWRKHDHHEKRWFNVLIWSTMETWKQTEADWALKLSEIMPVVKLNCTVKGRDRGKQKITARLKTGKSKISV